MRAHRRFGRWSVGVIGDLPDLEQSGIGEDALLDGAVVDDIARGRLDEALSAPEIVGHAVALGAAPEVLRRHEVAGEHPPEAVVIFGRKHPGERGDVGRGREVEPAEAEAPAQQLQVNRTPTGVSGRHIDPPLGLLGPLVQVHPLERVLAPGRAIAFSALRRELI
jgi:hypothetical protein